MSLLLPLILVLGLIILANQIAANGDARLQRAFTWLIVLLNAPLVVIGLALYFFQTESVPFFEESGLLEINIKSVSLILVATGLWGILASWSKFRRFLSSFLPLNADSPVHLTALILAGYLVANTALALSQEFLLQINPEELAVSVLDVVLQQTAFVIFALFGTGLLIRRDSSGVMQRLGVTKPTVGQLAAGVTVIFFLLFIQGTIGAIWALIDPEQAEQLGNINEALLAGFDSLGEWFVLALASGIGEELLFRGALQPVFGLPLSSLLFAVVHIQYGFTPITLVVFFLGLILGLVRRYTNTTVVIFVHFGYNFSLGLLSLLARYLQQFVTS